MVGNAALWVFLVVLCCVAVPSLATVYTVGETNGWTINYDYGTWTSGKTFAVGDTLVFNFAGGHTVDEVSESDYKTCTVGNSITTSSTGPTSVTLKTPGKHYFICGVIGHCGSGMKLAVTASGSASSPSTSPSSSTAGAAAGGGGAATTTTPVTTTPKTTTTTYSSSSRTICPTLVAGVLLVGLKLFM